MYRKLPPNPDLRHLRRQARDLLDGHLKGEVDAGDRIARSLPRFTHATASDVLSADVALQEAQHVVATEYGFVSWKQLLDFVAAARNRPSLVPDSVMESIDEALAEQGEDALPIELDLPEGRIVIDSVTSEPLWDSPEERGGTNREYRNLHFSASLHGPPAQTPEPQHAANWLDRGRYDSLRRIHEDLAVLLERRLRTQAGEGVAVSFEGLSYSTYMDVVSTSAEECIALRFALSEPGSTAAMVLPNPLLQTGIENVSLLILDALKDSWRPTGAIRPSGVEACPTPHHLEIAQYPEEVIGATYLAKCSEFSSTLQLVYPRDALLPLDIKS